MFFRGSPGTFLFSIAMHAEVNKVRLTVLIAMLFSALCAGVFRTTPIIFMAALLCGAPFVGIIVGTIASRSLRLSRHLPESGMAGDIISEKIVLKNEARFPVFLVHAQSKTTAHKPSRKENRAAAAASMLDERAQGTARSTPALIPMDDEEFIMPVLGAREESVWQRQLLLHRRGVHRIAPVRAGAFDPLGLYNQMPARSSSSEIVILPRPLKIERLGFLGGAGGSNLMPRHATIVADASDFHGARPWQPGETIRRAHWKSTARTGQLHVIEWEETPTADLAILLDTSAQYIIGDTKTDTLESAITAAASVACHLLENGCRVQLFYFQQQRESASGKKARAVVLSPAGLQQVEARSVHDANKVLRALAEIQSVDDASANLPHLLEAALPTVARQAGVLLLASVRADISTVVAGTGPHAGHIQCHALAFDAEPISTAQPENAVLNDATANPAPAAKIRHRSTSRTRVGRQHHLIQVVRGENALAAVLEGRD